MIGKRIHFNIDEDHHYSYPTLDKAVRESGNVVGFCECGCGTEMCKQNAIRRIKVVSGVEYLMFKVKERKYLPFHSQKDKRKNFLLSLRKKLRALEERE